VREGKRKEEKEEKRRGRGAAHSEGKSQAVTIQYGDKIHTYIPCEDQRYSFLYSLPAATTTTHYDKLYVPSIIPGHYYYIFFSFSRLHARIPPNLTRHRKITR